MTARERYDAMIRDLVAPRLRAEGFKRSAGTFRRRNEASWFVINFQASQASTREWVEFTVNLGVDIEVLRKPYRTDKPPREHECYFRERLGWLLPDRVPWDWWWVASDGTDYERLGHELGELLVTRALPWLEDRGTPERAREVFLAEVDRLDERRLGDALRLVEVTGPPSARETLEAMLRWRSTPDGRSELYRAQGEEKRTRPRPEGSHIYTPLD
jgi:Domain of unknown function (DUF4304)